ncbi:MAG: hypothetical protein KC933_28585 [Myxococcales bacterium]|nr:hypothetical protein [Myxococcales bacterium]
MEDIYSSLPIYMMVGIVVVIGVAQINRIAGALLSVVFWGAVAWVGSAAYDAGHAIGLPGLQFPQWVFLSVCAAFAGVQLFAAYTYVQSKKRAEARRRLLNDEDEDDEP